MIPTVNARTLKKWNRNT